ncbi:PD-(D/E)XK nuclease family protein [[Mycoplasma] gypis]|uniref:PD-(D/E)XK nuclease family protein n=1 Tax=[Mycoplasma] gypis TaxID=92404 RepID=A0ABZ2RW55_9BACT|nr:PD-(D/E)XK nuclease family protein [[Mycoplasma] gypis]MBN0919345.1 PD-(D/E)XK nuclease family protein [[Mycoplasma] gypis]
MNKKWLAFKTFSGSFTQENIGIEVINDFLPNKLIDNKFPIFVPSWGNVGNKKYKNDPYKDNEQYNDIEKIFVFEKTLFPKIYQLKNIINNPGKLKDIQEYNTKIKMFKYGPKNIALKDIKFENKEEKSVSSNALLISYLIESKNYLDFRNENIFVWIPNRKDDNSFEQDKDFFCKSIKPDENDKKCQESVSKFSETLFGRNNHIVNLGKDFVKWYESKISKIEKEREVNEYKMLKLKNSPKIKGRNYESIIQFVEKMNDELLYTNFITKILQKNNDLLLEFTKFIVSMIKEETTNEILGDLTIQKNKSVFVAEKEKKGIADMVIQGSNIEIIIENKILSGINGIDKNNKEQTQLDIYKRHLQNFNNKKTFLFILCPESQKSHFSKYENDKKVNAVLSYKCILDFFEQNIKFIDKKFRKEFLYILKFQALTIEEKNKQRFYEVLNKK